MNIPENSTSSSSNYECPIQDLVRNLPNNSLTKLALEAIQKHLDLPKYYSKEMQSKIKDLQNRCHKTDLSEEELLVIHRIFEEKTLEIGLLSERTGSTKEYSSVHECLENFSVDEREIVLEFVRFFTGAVFSEKDRKPLEDLMEYVETISLEEMRVLLSLIQAVRQPSELVTGDEKTQQLVSLISGMRRSEIKKEDDPFLIFNLSAVTLNKSFEESEILFAHINELIRELTPPNPAEVVHFMSCQFPLVFINKSFKESADLLERFKEMFPEGSSNKEKFAVIKELSKVSIRKSFEESKKYLELIREVIPKGITPNEAWFGIRFLVGLMEESELKELEGFLDCIKSMIPKGITPNKIWGLTSKFLELTRTCSSKLKECKEALGYIKSIIPEGLTPNETYCLTELLLALRNEKKLEKIEVFLGFIQCMIPEGLTPNEIYDVINWLTVLPDNANYPWVVSCLDNEYEMSEALLRIEAMIPKGVSSSKKLEFIMFLVSKFNKINPNPGLRFIEDKCKIEGLSDEAKYHSVFSLLRGLIRKPIKDIRVVLNHIKVFLPASLVPLGVANVLSRLGEAKSEEVIEIIKMPNYVEHWELLSLNVLPFIGDSMHREAIMAFLDEFIPPKINTKDEAEHLSQVIEPFIWKCKTPEEVQQLCDIFKAVPEELRFQYSKLAKQFSSRVRDVGSLIKWMQKIDTKASTQEEFCDSLKQYLEELDSLDKYELALDVLTWERVGEAALIESSRWIILRHEYTTSLEELIESLPLNDFTYSALSEILSGRELLKQGPESFFKKLLKLQEKQDLSHCHQASEKGKEALNEVFKQKIETKINQWKDLSLQEKVEVMLEPFGLKSSSLPPEWQLLSNDAKYHVLLTAQILEIKSVEALIRLSVFSSDRLDEVVLSIFSLLSDSMTDKERAYITHECIKDVSPLNLRDWMALIKNTPSWETIRDLLLRKIEYAGLKPYFLPLVKSDMSMTVMEKILEELTQEPIEPEILIPFMKKGMSVDTVSALFSAFRRIPNDLRVPYRSLIISLLERNPDTLDVCSLAELCVLAGIPPETTKETFEATVLAKLSLLPQATKIFDCQKGLKLQDDSSLIKGSVVIILAGPKDTPYYTHAVIKQKKQEYPASQVSMPVTQIPSQSKYRAQIQLNLSGLQNGLQIVRKQEKTYGEFEAWVKERNKVHQDRNPETVLLGPSVFKDLLNRLEKHLISQNLKDQLKEVREITENVTNKELLTEKLMSRPLGDESVKVPETIIRLYAIAEAILSESSESSPGSLFSPQEEAIMTWLRLIQHCAVGQEAGISVCYHDLQAGGNIPRQQTSSKYETEAAEQEMATALQKAMNDVIQSPQILRRLGVEDYIRKGVHQALFLRNLIGEECGLNHEETMETLPKEISEKLLAYDRKYILEVFFYELSLHLVDSLKGTFNGLSPELKNKRYSLNQSFFSYHHVDLTKAWVLEENPPKVRFLGKVQEESINVRIFEKCRRKIPEQSEFWFLQKGQTHLTEKGWELFEVFLVKEGEDPSSEASEERRFLRFLQFVEDLCIQNYKEQFYHSNTGELTEEGESILRKELMDPNSRLYKTMKRMELSIEQVTSNIKNYPLILTSFLQTVIPKREAPWSLQDQPASYELTEFGALALLEKGGYLQVQGNYGRYLNLMIQLGEISEKLSFVEPLTIENVQNESFEKGKRVERLKRIPFATPDEKAEKELSQIRLESLKEYERIHFEVSVLERDLALELPSENVPPVKPAFQERLF